MGARCDESCRGHGGWFPIRRVERIPREGRVLAVVLVWLLLYLVQVVVERVFRVRSRVTTLSGSRVSRFHSGSSNYQ